MRTIIAGSRGIRNYWTVHRAVTDSGFSITEVVSGGALGVDRLGEAWAWPRGIKVKRFKPDWAKHGKAAGCFRNTAMAEYAEALVAVWDGESRGTAHMIREARRLGLKVYVHRTDQR